MEAAGRDSVSWRSDLSSSLRTLLISSDAFQGVFTQRILETSE